MTHALEARVVDVDEGGVELRLHAADGLARVALGQGLADADDRRQAGAQRRARLQVDRRVQLAEQLPPLRVADDDVLAADVGELRGATSPVNAPLSSQKQSCAATVTGPSSSRLATA